MLVAPGSAWWKIRLESSVQRLNRSPFTIAVRYPATFSGLTSLVSLDLCGIPILELPGATLAESTLMRELFLEQSIHVLHGKAFAGLANLVELALQGIHIVNLAEETLW